MNDDNDCCPSVELLTDMFAVLERALNPEQRARLLACAAIAWSVEVPVMRKLREASSLAGTRL